MLSQLRLWDTTDTENKNYNRLHTFICVILRKENHVLSPRDYVGEEELLIKVI